MGDFDARGAATRLAETAEKEINAGDPLEKYAVHFQLISAWHELNCPNKVAVMKQVAEDNKDGVSKTDARSEVARKATESNSMQRGSVDPVLTYESDKLSLTFQQYQHYGSKIMGKDVASVKSAEIKDPLASCVGNDSSWVVRQILKKEK